MGGWREQTGIIQAGADGNGTPWGQQVYVGGEEEEGEGKEARVGEAGEGEDGGRWGREQPTLVHSRTATSPELPSLGILSSPIIPSGFRHPARPSSRSPLSIPCSASACALVVLRGLHTVRTLPATNKLQRLPHTRNTACRESAHRSRSYFAPARLLPLILSQISTLSPLLLCAWDTCGHGTPDFISSPRTRPLCPLAVCRRQAQTARSIGTRHRHAPRSPLHQHTLR